MSDRMEAFGRTWRRVWHEDECTRGLPGHTGLSAAWRKRYGDACPAPSKPADAVEDWGDAMAYRHCDRMEVHCHDGASIWEEESGFLQRKAEQLVSAFIRTTRLGVELAVGA